MSKIMWLYETEYSFPDSTPTKCKPEQHLKTKLYKSKEDLKTQLTVTLTHRLLELIKILEQPRLTVNIVRVGVLPT